MKMIKLIGMGGVLALLSACDSSDRGRIVDFEVRQVEIISVNMPKHFSVDVRDNVSGTVFRDVARSKHCNGARTTAKIGKTYNAVFTVMAYANGRRGIAIDNSKLNSLLCG